MDEAKYKDWWPLHIKRAKGEPLTAVEQAICDAGYAEQDAEEEAILRGNGIEKMRRMRLDLAAAEAEQTRLLDRQGEVKARIAAMESKLDENTRQLLGIGN